MVLSQKILLMALALIIVALAFFHGQTNMNPQMRTVIGAPRVAWNDGELYTKDSEYVYYGNTIVSGADPNTFVLLKDAQGGPTDFAKDKNHVYDAYVGDVIQGADPNTFVPVDDIWYGKDENSVYSLKSNTVDDTGYFSIPGADPSTFTVVADPASCAAPACLFDSKDKNHEYLRGQQIVQ
jgi:hypothetical protein